MEDLQRYSTISLAHTQAGGKGTPLNGCLVPQHHYIHISINDSKGKIVADVNMSYDQFVRFITSNISVTCTLNRYVEAGTGELKSEEVPFPESVQDRAIERFGESHESLQKRILDLERDVYELLNGGKAVGKKRLEGLLGDIRVIKEWHKGNTAFVVQQGIEEISHLQEQAQVQLSMFLEERGVQVSPERLGFLLSTESQVALPEPKGITPTTGYELKEREAKPIEDMTAMEVADKLSALLKWFEAQQRKRTEAENNELYCANASAPSANHVNIQYISYQGSRSIMLELAKQYLKLLQEQKDKGLGFVHHYALERK